MKKLNIIPPNEDIIELITRKYCDKGNNKEVNYVFFCADIDRPEDMFPGYNPKRPVAPPAENPHAQRGAMKSTFFQETTKGVNVMESRFS